MNALKTIGMIALWLVGCYILQALLMVPFLVAGAIIYPLHLGLGVVLVLVGAVFFVAICWD
jgi:hypothetical protein